VKKIKLQQIGEIVEVGEYFYLKLKIGDTFIIQKIQLKTSRFAVKLKQIAQRFEIDYTTNLNWKW
jgi:hypothetical protein